jgi:hypothetical protein
VEVALASVIVVAGTAHAQPGTAFLQARGGAMIPVGSFHHDQNTGGAYSIAAGYEFTDFFDMMLEFTHSFNDNDNFHFEGQGLKIESDETHQTFIVGIGPRINFMPSGSPVRPFMLVQGGWYHFANFNSIEIDGTSILGDEDDDAVGVQAGLGLEGTIFQLYERRGDEIPVLELTVGVHGSYHQAFMPNRADRQFVTTMGSFGARF